MDKLVIKGARENNLKKYFFRIAKKQVNSNDWAFWMW